MKRVLLSLLICGIHVSALSQIEVPETKTENPDKWTITPVKGMKGALGRLNTNFPAGVNWHIMIYRQADNKFISSNQSSSSYKAKSYNIAPGVYRITLNNVPVENVPIQKGHETRLKAGFLNVGDEGQWTLRDDKKEKFYNAGNKPEKIALPFGSYQLMTGENYTQVEIKDEPPVPENIGIIEASNNWIITPLEAMATGMGKLSIIIPKDTTVYIPIIDKTITMQLNVQDTIRLSETGSYNTYTVINLPKYLMTKTYYINLNRVRFTVPVKSGKETRIKAGFLTITRKRNDDDMTDDEERFWEKQPGAENIPEGELWTWELKSKDGGIIATGKKRRIYALPPGEYRLTKFAPYSAGAAHDIHYTVIIKDGEWVKNGVKQ